MLFSKLSFIPLAVFDANVRPVFTSMHDVSPMALWLVDKNTLYEPYKCFPVLEFSRIHFTECKFSFVLAELCALICSTGHTSKCIWFRLTSQSVNHNTTLQEYSFKEKITRVQTNMYTYVLSAFSLFKVDSYIYIFIFPDPGVVTGPHLEFLAKIILFDTFNSKSSSLLTSNAKMSPRSFRHPTHHRVHALGGRTSFLCAPGAGPLLHAPTGQVRAPWARRCLLCAPAAQTILLRALEAWTRLICAPRARTPHRTPIHAAPPSGIL